jgi:peptide chain release factor 2
MDEDRKQQLWQLLRIEDKERRITEIQNEMNDPGFWSERDRATSMTQELSDLQKLVSEWQKAETDKDLEALETKALLSGPYDKNKALLSLYAGAGGTEAQDWAGMLLRMYSRWAEKKGFQFTILDETEGAEAGIKSATARVSGLFAYGYLKAEHGVHRLVRISPYDADKARHTSFALVEIIPEIEEAKVVIEDKDLKIDTFRSSGHGGQSVQKTESAVRLTHIPTGLTVSVQNERSQHQNKETALKILKSRLTLFQEAAQKKEAQILRGGLIKPEWGNQIRSYVLHPYKMVKDHRTEHESKDPDAVLSGSIDDFIEVYLRRHAGQT